MKYYSKKIVVLLLSLAMTLSMSVLSVFADDGNTGVPFGKSITVIDGDGVSHEITGTEIQAASSKEVTSEKPWKYNNGETKECFGKFYSMKDVLDTAGIDFSKAHGLKVVASDGFRSGVSKDEIDKMYIFDMSEVSRAGEYGTAGTYGVGIEDYEGTTAGNRWGTDVVTIEVVGENDHAWFFKKGACKHYCVICGNDEPSVVINPDSDNVKVYDCMIRAAGKKEVTSENPWKYNTTKECFGTFYSMKDVLDTAGIDFSKAHGLKVVASDGFRSGVSKDEIDKMYIFDMSEVSRAGEYGTAGTYGVGIEDYEGTTAGNRWGTDVVTIEVVGENDHAWFFKKGACKHYCVICDEKEASNEIEAEVPATCTEAGKTAVVKYECGGEDGGKEIPALGHSWNDGEVTKAATTTAEGVKTYTCTVCGETKTEIIAKLAKKAQPLTVKAKTATIKYKKLKKKAQTIAVSKALTASNAQGALTYKITKVNKNKKYFKINSTTGKITVKKKLKKGTYKVTVQVTAAGNDAYLSGDKTVIVNIKVK